METVHIDDLNDDHDDSCAEKEQSITSGEGDITCASGSLIGIKRDKFEDIYDLYNNHALEVGFSIRKSTTRYNTSNQLVSRCLVCSCQGTRNNDNSSSNNQEHGRKRASNFTRTNCKAMLRAKVDADGVYEVINHNTEHNHPLSRRELSHLHRSQRKITNEKAVVIEDMISSGMRPSDSFRYMAHDAGGEDVLGHTRKDHFNFVNRMKIAAIEGGDAQTLIDILDQQGVEDQEFFFRVKLDDDGRLCNVFWRDSTMKDDYMIYGDVVVFDTTYRTNKYNLICAPFVGINNHWKNVMFGCAFLSNEKIESFQWLFEVFIKSMEGRSPVTMFTDQDHAIAHAIEKSLPTTRHRLCIWHLYQKAQSRLGNLKSNKGFIDAFQKCLSGCVDRDDFEKCWSSMVSNYELEDKSWFQRLYELRDKWCTAYNKDFFSAGILSSQRSESTNNAIGFSAKKTTNLTEFYNIFKNTVKRWRSNELSDDFKCTRATPNSVLSMTGLIKHACEVYTETLFRDFEKEFLKSLSASFSLLGDELEVKLYQVIEDDCKYIVSFYEMSCMLTCSCKRFEECGLLCSHCLRILLTHSVDRIPECYIKKRWTKLAKQGLWDKSSEQTKSYSPWRHQMVRKYYTLVLKAQETEEERAIIEDGLNGITTALEAFSLSRNESETGTRWETRNGSEETGASSGSSINVKDPLHSITKGRKQRKKGYLERGKKKKKTCDASNSIQSKEFGTKTPNQRLF